MAHMSLKTEWPRTSGRRVTGVKGIGTEIAADLVIDASGRGSHSPDWLAALGYPKPVEERVEVALAYTTRFFRRPAVRKTATTQ